MIVITFHELGELDDIGMVQPLHYFNLLLDVLLNIRFPYFGFIQHLNCKFVFIFDYIANAFTMPGQEHLTKTTPANRFDWFISELI